MRLLQKSCNHDVAANFPPRRIAWGDSLRVFFVFSALQTQAKACGYQNRSFARASYAIKYLQPLDFNINLNRLK
jgi:hypothetical protein